MKYLLIPIIIGILSQCIKFIFETIKYKKINLLRLFDGMGGMPSTHSALVASLATLIYLDYRFLSPITATTIIFALIVIYDSMGIRYESGKQARIINKISGSNLKEKLGHEPLETLAGVLLGITFSIIINYIVG